MGTHFFFQAEDGIRDGRVTGVQTCALPIWKPTAAFRTMTTRTATASTFCPRANATTVAVRSRATIRLLSWSTRRSEERRVGKECRSRWSPHLQKKKTSERTQHSKSH